MSADRPGALLGMRLSVLAAECADPERFGRGRAYFRQGAVSGLEVGPGSVSAQVQGSEASPYEVSLLWRAGGARPGPIPTRAELVGTCSCRDVQAVCKHVVAVIFATAALVTDDPEVLDTWRGDPSMWEHLPVPAEALAPPAGPTSPDRPEIVAFFGSRAETAEFDVADLFPEIQPLGVPARGVPSAVEEAVAECLDSAMAVLRSVYG